MEPKLPPPIVPNPVTPRFDFQELSQVAQAKRYLDKHGYVIAKNVLTAEEIKKAKDLFWGFVVGIPTRFPKEFTNEEKENWAKRDNVKTWSTNWPADPKNGIFSKFGIGQSAFLWFVRSRPLVKKVFQEIWEDKDLLVSFDGCGVFRPWKYNSSWKTNGGWYHVDQNAATKPDRESVQGLISLYDGGRSTGGLTVIDNSVKDFKGVQSRIDESLKGTWDFVPIPKTDEILQTPGHLVCCKAGDLLLWDSRTIHCNSPGDSFQIDENTKVEVKKTDDGPWDLIRLVCYVCMTPRKKASKEILEERKCAVEKGVTTNHWPHEYHADEGAPKFLIANTPYVEKDLI
eukprot:TRINITY_DN1223_c0_g1_i1.p1 TRINITY_DN1223_c0_g1~~TRINITY_DN1223_c0_g1_i1.p1  ORF type:complete len:391 (+),score=105.53 TRINITY_DN1223_c0_g1_i1:145-1173(+)